MSEEYLQFSDNTAIPRAFIYDLALIELMKEHGNVIARWRPKVQVFHTYCRICKAAPVNVRESGGVPVCEGCRDQIRSRVGPCTFSFSPISDTLQIDSMPFTFPIGIKP